MLYNHLRIGHTYLTHPYILKDEDLRRPYNLYCVGADVKPCSINQLIPQYVYFIILY